MNLFQYCTVILLLLFLTKQSEEICVDSWMNYVNEYSKTFEDSIEEQQSKNIWLKNIQIIKDQNEKANAGESSYWLAQNKFTDTVNDFN